MLVILAFVGLEFNRPAQAIVNAVSPAIAANTPTDQPLNPGGASCSYGNAMYSAWTDATNGVVNVVTSTDGVSWSTATLLTTMINLPATGSALITSAYIASSCENGQMTFAWMDNSHGLNDWRVDYQTCALSLNLATPVCSGTVTGPNRGACCTHPSSTPVHLATSSSIYNVKFLNGHVLILINNQGIGRMFINDNLATINTTSIAAVGMGLAYTGGASGTYVVTGSPATEPGATWQYMWSSDFQHWNGPTTVSSLNGGNQYFGSSSQGNNGIVGFGGFAYAFVDETHSGNGCTTTSCLVMDKISVAGTLTQTGVGDITASTAPIVTTDGGSTILVVVDNGGSGSGYALSSNSGSQWSIAGFTGAGSTAQGGASLVPMSIGPYFSSSLNAVQVTSVSTSGFTVWTQVFGIPTSTSQTGTVSIGSCPTKNTATTALTNSTQFFYTATAQGGQVITNITTSVASVNAGHVASENLWLMMYVTASAGQVSVANPLFLINAKEFTLSATSTPQLVNWAGTSGPNIVAGATFGIAILGNSKILINQSSLAGMTTAASGGASPGTPQSSAITSLTATATQLYLCGRGSFSIVQTTTVTTTITVTSLSTTTVGTAGTTTTTVTSLDQNAALTNSVNYVLVIFMVLGPAVILSSMGALLTRSAALTGSLFIAGMVVGAGAGNLSGIVPFNILALVVVLIVFMILGLIMIIRAGGGSSGG